MIRHGSESECSIDLSLATIYNFGLISKKTLMTHRKSTMKLNLSQRKQTEMPLKTSGDLYINLEDSSKEKVKVSISQDINTSPISSPEKHFTTEKGDELSSCGEEDEEDE